MYVLPRTYQLLISIHWLPLMCEYTASTALDLFLTYSTYQIDFNTGNFDQIGKFKIYKEFLFDFFSRFISYSPKINLGSNHGKILIWKGKKYIIIWDFLKKHPKANRNIGGLGPQNKSEKSWIHAIKSPSNVPYFSSSEIKSGAGPSSISPFIVCLFSWPLPSPAVYKGNFTSWFQDNNICLRQIWFVVLLLTVSNR